MDIMNLHVHYTWEDEIPELQLDSPSTARIGQMDLGATWLLMFFHFHHEPRGLILDS